MNNRFLSILCLFFFVGVAVSCHQKNENSAQQTKTENKNNFQYIFDNGSTKLNVEVTKVPQKAALYSHFITEMFLALGLEDKIVLGTTEGEILPEFKKAYEKVPNKIVGHHTVMTKEAFLLLGADFVSGWDEAVRAETTGTADELLKKGIYVIGFFYPVVPKDKARIRVQLSAAHTKEHLDKAISSFTAVGKMLHVI